MSRFHNLDGPEKQVYEEALTLFNELFEYLHVNDKLRKGIPHDEREKLRKMWSLSRQMGLALNKMIEIIDPTKMKQYVENNKEFNLDEQNFTDTVITQMVGHFIYNIETVLRFSLCFFLKKEGSFKSSMALGQLIHAIDDEAPLLSSRFKSMIDIELRNTLGHGAFWFESPNICYTQDFEFTNTNSEPFHEFWIRTKKQNLRAHALTEAINNAIRKNYFLDKST